MILDDGICTIYRKTNTAGPAEKPVFADVAYWQSWFKHLSFETASARPTDSREEVRTSARIRVLQCRQIDNHDRAAVTEMSGATRFYEVTRAYHGTDDESGELITDLNLEVVEP